MSKHTRGGCFAIAKAIVWFLLATFGLQLLVQATGFDLKTHTQEGCH